MKSYLILFSILLLPQQLLAALAVDSQMPSNAGVSATVEAGLTYSFTNTAGTLLVCAVQATDAGAANVTVSAVTYAGAGLTKFNEQRTSAVSSAWNYLWYKLNPATGANNVVITTSGTPTSDAYVISGCISFTGNHATTPLINSTTKADTGSPITDSLNVTGTVSGNIVICSDQTGSSISSYSQTLSWLLNLNGDAAGNNAVLQRVAGGGTKNFSVTLSAGDHHTFVAAEVQAPSSGSPYNYYNMMRQQ